MQDQTKNLKLEANRTVRFRELVTWWADHLGRHHVPVVDHSDNINNFLGPDAVHHDLIQKVVRSVYCANRCGHLDACVSLDDTFTALGQVRQALANSSRADIDQIDLLDNIGWHTRQCLGLETESEPSLPKSNSDLTEAEILPLLPIRAS